MAGGVKLLKNPFGMMRENGHQHQSQNKSKRRAQNEPSSTIDAPRPGRGDNGSPLIDNRPVVIKELFQINSKRGAIRKGPGAVTALIRLATCESSSNR